MKGWFAAMKLKGRIRMNQEFNSARNVYLDREDQGVVRQLCCTLMLRLPSKAGIPQLPAADYLHQFGELLGLPLAELANSSLTPSASETPCRLARLPKHGKS
jgi:hypothetical protein